jgi:type IV secretory pathway VirB10-like protein
MAIGKLVSTLSNTKTRTMVLFSSAVVLLGLGVAVTQFGRENDPLSTAASQTAKIPTKVSGTPGNNTSKQYRELLVEDNKQRYEEAAKKKESAVPTIVAEELSQADEQKKLLDNALGTGGFEGNGVFNQKNPATEAISRQEKILQDQQVRLDKMRDEQRLERDADKRKRQQEDQDKQFVDAMNNLSSSMVKRAQGYTQNWVTVPKQAYKAGVLAPNANTIAKEYAENKKAVADSTYASVQGLGGAYQIKAGTILYGVLDTGINSDEKSPILARIVTGEYKGAKLIGEFKKPANADRVVLQFSRLTLPEASVSFAVNIYAVDPDTARTALATDVDHHYLSRYGSLFAASFMEGYGKAIKDSGSVQTNNPGSNTTTTTSPNLSGSEQFFAALGTIGEKWSAETKTGFNRPTTVYVESGTSIGLLVMDDVNLNEQVAANPASVATRPNFDSKNEDAQ